LSSFVDISIFFVAITVIIYMYSIICIYHCLYNSFSFDHRQQQKQKQKQPKNNERQDEDVMCCVADDISGEYFASC
jgi:hypothetical protein